MKPVNTTATPTLWPSEVEPLLLEVAERLRTAIRPSDTLARFGGDEFVVVQSQVSDPKDVDRLAARLRVAFDEPVAFGKESVTIGTSIGTSRFPGDGRDVQALLVRADQQLYRVERDAEPPPPSSQGACPPGTTRAFGRVPEAEALTLSLGLLDKSR